MPTMKISALLASAFLTLALAHPTARAAEPAKLVLSEDFDSTPVGEIPTGFTKAGAVGVTEETAHSGKKCLRIEPAVKGGRKIIKQGPEITALGGEHWGRLYMKVKLPTPVPVIPEGKKSAVIHSTIVEGTAKSPLFNDPIALRLVSSCTSPKGTSTYLFNVQPKKERKEFSQSTKSIYHYSDQWTLVEWHVDHATQTFQLFLDGKEITDAGVSKGAGHFEGAEIPAVFETLSFGWTNYQAAPEGQSFTAWIDDIALSKERIGGSNK
ncbi:MAG: hypothetical protein JWO08_2408 [Verrucomicrobiaceae bacterium]|nr:hypothetical protein [Verrucomicrobiaceae bacterium]